MSVATFPTSTEICAVISKRIYIENLRVDTGQDNCVTLEGRCGSWNAKRIAQQVVMDRFPEILTQGHLINNIQVS